MVLIDDEPWFVGKDVAENLGYSNPRKAITDHVDEDDKGVTKCDTLGGTQNLTIINESGVYSLILSSKLPQAKEFKKWVTSEILPTIRRTGMYIQENLSPEIQALICQDQKIQRLDKKIDNVVENLYLSPYEVKTIQKRINQIIVPALGGKGSPAYQDASIRGKAYANIYCYLCRAFGLYYGGIRLSYTCLKRKNYDKVHEVIDSYELPKFLKEEINEINYETLKIMASKN